MPKRVPQGLRRKLGAVPPFARIAVVCEGEVTEPKYLNALKGAELASSAHIIEVKGGVGVPLTVVRRAVKLKKGGNYDEVWCVFDVDDHPKLPEALDQACANGLRLAVSNPCFELWGLLHFQDQRSELGRKQLCSKLKKHLPGYKKALAFEKLDPNRELALRRAAGLDRMHRNDKKPPSSNPSTGVAALVEKIAGLGRAARLKKLGR